MSNQKSKTIIGTPITIIYILYILFVINTEWINYIFRQLNLDWHFGIAEMFSVIFLATIFFGCRKKYVTADLSINIEVFLGIFFIVLYGLAMSVYPDNTYDTYNYHLIAQNPKFTNYFVEDFGYGNFQVWGFRLADRLFYYFRYVLGFRYGTILNILVAIISFIQLYSLISDFTINWESSRLVCLKMPFLRGIWTLIILFPLDAILMFGTYYVDILALPIAIEIVRILMNEYSKSHTSENIMYFALLNGIFLAMKLTNIVYVIPCVIIYLVEHYKTFKIRNWLGAVLCGIYPSAVYLLFNWSCTGNPIFPYYNTIFKSPYYPLHNFKDLRWGGNTFIEKLFWIYFAAFKPGYQQCEICDKIPAVLIIALVGIIILLFMYLFLWIKRRQKPPVNFIVLFLLTITASILWSFTTGYSRYFVFGKLMWGLLVVIFFLEIISNFKTIGKILVSGCSFCLLMCVLINFYLAASGRNWSWTKFDDSTFKKQFQFVLKDRDYTTDYQCDADLFVLTSPLSMGVAELIKPNIYTINTSYKSFVPIEDYEKIFNEHMNNVQHAYDIHSRNFSDIGEYINTVNNSHLYITDMSPIEISIGNYEMIALHLLKNKTNALWISDSEEISIDVKQSIGTHTLTFLHGRYYDWDFSSSAVIKLLIGSEEIMREIASINVDNYMIQKAEISFDIADTDKILIIKFEDLDGELISMDEPNKIFIINPEIK